MKRLGAVVLVLALLAACSGGEDDGADTTTTTTATTAPTPTTEGAAEVEVFEGSVDDFYVVPDPLPEGEPGDLIRTQVVGEVDGRASVRVMYHSEDAAGTDRAVTGIVTYPTAAAPDGGWPVISTAHGTTGVAEQCALSRSATEAPGWGVEGVWAMTDYVGQGPVGELHPYLSKPSEGNAVIDAVRAARQLPDAGAGERWVSIGHSQGGHGALSAHELAAERAPELELVGTVALAPAAMLDRVYGGIDPIVTAILTMMAVVSGVGEHPDIDPADYLTPEALAASSIFETGCLDEITEALIPIAIAGAFIADPRETEPAASLVRENDVGEVAIDGVPVYLASGTVDDRVVIDRVRDLFDRMCSAGQVTELTVIDGADHGSILPATAEAVTAFIEARLAGEEPTDSCGADAAGEPTDG
ncbi:MAG TPA: lipase family protein [Iamia sp.]|nr:lipase family protein [Iamia sp.]